MNDNKVMIKMHKTAITQLSTIELMAKTDWFFVTTQWELLFQI